MEGVAVIQQQRRIICFRPHLLDGGRNPGQAAQCLEPVVFAAADELLVGFDIAMQIVDLQDSEALFHCFLHSVFGASVVVAG